MTRVRVAGGGDSGWARGVRWSLWGPELLCLYCLFNAFDAPPLLPQVIRNERPDGVLLTFGAKQP